MDVFLAGAVSPSWTLAFLFLSTSLFFKVSIAEVHLVDEWTEEDIELIEDEELEDFFFIFFMSIFHNIEDIYIIMCITLLGESKVVYQKKKRKKNIRVEAS